MEEMERILSIVDMAKELYLKEEIPCDISTEEQYVIKLTNIALAESYTKGSLRSLRLIEEIIDAGCKDSNCEKLLRDRIALLRQGV